MNTGSWSSSKAVHFWAHDLEKTKLSFHKEPIIRMLQGYCERLGCFIDVLAGVFFFSRRICHNAQAKNSDSCYGVPNGFEGISVMSNH